MQIEFARLTRVAIPDLVALFNHADVRRHLPLATGEFSDAMCARFVAAKERIWVEHGYGPWAFLVDGRFAGWGGLQPEAGDADLGLVLHPEFWGIGPVVCRKILQEAFGRPGRESVIVLLPPTRTRIRAVLRAGFRPDGEIEIAGERFVRYRLLRCTYLALAGR